MVRAQSRAAPRQCLKAPACMERVWQLAGLVVEPFLRAEGER
jgi:hypothetical protein